MKCKKTNVRRSRRREPCALLVTGGAGFIGSNLSDRLAESGHRVRILDNLSRAGVYSNLEWLAGRHGTLIDVVHGDVRDAKVLQKAVAGVAAIYHLAAQAAVTTSIADPFLDFSTNLQATFQLLETVRLAGKSIPLVFTSTNKVYGNCAGLRLRPADRRYVPVGANGDLLGVGENAPLDFHGPYGCSKGAADQYVLDYSRSFRMPTVVFRMSCIYGPRQFGTEDQGWVAHFLLQAMRRAPLTIYGDGKQVRDLLFVDDLVNALLAANQHVQTVSGEAFNIGGGVERSVSLFDVIAMVESILNRRLDLQFQDWRIGDQRYYVSDTRKAERMLAWRPRITVADGISRLHKWLAGRRLDTPRPAGRVESTAGARASAPARRVSR